MSRGIFAAVALGLAGCAAAPAAEAPVARAATEMTPDQQAAFYAGAPTRRSEAAARIGAMSKEEIASAMTRAVSNRTRMFLQQGHDVYLEYTNAQGQLFMWYPGNTGVVFGTWMVANSFFPPRTCFRYSNATHGVTGEYEPNECIPPEQVIGRPYEFGARDGDPFNLASGKIPYVKTKTDVPAWPG